MHQLWIMNADGGDARQLAAADGPCIAGSWSSDGKQIAFARNDGSEPQPHGLKIWIAEADGSQARRLTTAEGKQIDENVPRWSPDGKRIAFTSNQHGGLYQIEVAEVASGRTEVLTKAYHDNELNADVEQKVPSWSPDGKRIAYWCGVEMNDPRPDLPRDVWVMRADVTGQKRLVGGDDPNWSPTGELIIHSAVVDGKPSLRIVRPDGTGAQILFFVEAVRPLVSSWVDRK